MPDIIQRLKDAYIVNPAEALAMLPELFQAADGGKIVELPCKVGDMLFCVKAGKIQECECWGFQTYKRLLENSVYIYDPETEPTEQDLYQVPTSSIGKTVFLTREAAEKALKERET